MRLADHQSTSEAVDDSQFDRPFLGHVAPQQRYDLGVSLDADDSRIRPVRRYGEC
jgi:hypothetical protein